MDRKRRIHFSWNNAYWSCTHEVWVQVQATFNNNEPLDLVALGCRQVKTKPSYLRTWAARGASPFPPLTKSQQSV